MTRTATTPVGIAIVGCGNISRQYLENLPLFPDVAVVACADLDLERAAAVAGRYGVPVSGSVEDVLAHPDVELVVNLTIPAVHVEVSMAAVAAGRHVYSEKPLALERAGAGQLVAAAEQAGVRLGVAPDTFLGPGMQTVYRAIASGTIGEPLSALTLMQGPGPEAWHPAPEFLFQHGAGPLFDMGPYYLTALAVMFGPVVRVAGTGRKGRESRVVGSGDRAGTRFDVEVPTHVSTLLEFAGGQVATSVFSFDSPLVRHDFFEVTGTEATLAVPNPNGFSGPVRTRRAGDDGWATLAEAAAPFGRGLGVLDLARAARTGRAHRADGALGAHVVDVMESIIASADTGEFVTVTSSFDVPAPLPEGWDPARTIDDGGDG